MKKNIIIADNQLMTSYGLLFFIQQYKTWQGKISKVTSKKDLVEELSVEPESIVFLDYALFDIASIDLLLVLMSRFKDAYWAFFSSDFSSSFLLRISIEPNVSILSKQLTAEELELSFNQILCEEKYICKEIQSWFEKREKEQEQKEKIRLTKTEREILKLIALGLSTKEIATKRNSSSLTIATHKKNIFKKLEVNTVYEAMRYAIRTGIISDSDFFI